jgi:hypothetical protein
MGELSAQVLIVRVIREASLLRKLRATHHHRLEVVQSQ